MNENTSFDSTDFRNTLPRFTPEARKANQALVDLLGEIAKRKNAMLVKLHLRGCSRRSRGLFQYPEQQNWSGFERTLAPHQSS
jgi:hypothetical protein